MTTSRPQNEIKAIDIMTEKVEMNDLTPDADPDQDEEMDSDQELRNLEGENAQRMRKIE